MSDFTEMVDLAGERLGGVVMYATDDFFASKDNLLLSSKPVFLDGKYTDRGKWMDGWESRRKRVEGHDHCIVRLGVPGIVHGVVLDTAFFKGNYPSHCSLEGCSVPGNPDVQQLESAETVWTEILPRAALQGDAINPFAIASRERFTHLRLHIYPDGGVARMRVYGEVLPSMRWLGLAGMTQEVDLAAAEHGASVTTCNDMFFGSRHNLIMPGRSVNMGDGWETRRGRRPGPDWVIVQLAAEGTLTRIEVDTNYFKGNFPESCAIAVCRAPNATVDELLSDKTVWTEVLSRTKLQAHTRHFYENELAEHGAATHARVFIWPDGGISRLRLHGVVSDDGRLRLGMRVLNALTRAEFNTAMRACCHAQTWIDRMGESRSFASFEALLDASDRHWNALGPAGWKEAFQGHPRIGEKNAQAAQSATARRWSSQEQSGMSSADETVRAELAQGNKAYEARFGYIFLIRAAGRSAQEMLDAQRARLANDPDTEVRVAAEEHRQIMALRLRKLVTT